MNRSANLVANTEHNLAWRMCPSFVLGTDSQSLIKNPDFLLGTYRARETIASGIANMLLC